MTDATEAASPRAFGSDDLDAGARLVEQAGWNQVEDDWRIFLARGEVFAIDAPAGGVIATAATLPYAGFAWISMVLVDVAWRRRGLASVLLERCVASIRASGRTPMLDATPAGRAVYSGLGFRDGLRLQRWARGARPAIPPTPVPGDSVRACTARDLPAMAELDAAAFGASREWLLDMLAARSTGFGAVAERDGRIAGFVLGRPGRVATQVGPLVVGPRIVGPRVASDAATATALLRYAVSRLPGALVLDALEAHLELPATLEALGFARQRPYTRMAWESDVVAGDPRCYVAAAGPELG